jgi:hypothetical protein
MSVDSRPRGPRWPARLRHLRRVPAACVAALALVAGTAMSLPGRRLLGHYDFGYAIRGDRAARPAQVFDDGAGKIFFQLRPGQPMPAVFVGQTPELLVMQPEGQYFTARTGEGEFTLALGDARATVRRGEAALGPEVVSWRDDAGGRLLASAEPGLPVGVDLEPGSPARPARVAWHEQPIVFRAGSAVLRPEVLEALDALVVRIGRDAAVVVTGRNDAGAQDPLARRRAQALRNALLARGVPARHVDILGVEPEPDADHPVRASTLGWRGAGRETRANTPSPFAIRSADGDIATTLRRWARAEGFEIVWDLPWEAPADAVGPIDAATFLDAVRQVVTGLRAQGYDVQAQAYADRVVRLGAAR